MLITEQRPNRVQELIDAGIARTTTAYTLAKHIGYSAEEISMWRKAKRPCPLEAQILIAAVVGKNVDEVIHDALIERNAGTPRGEKLLTALGKGLMVAGGVTVITLYANDALASKAANVLRCIFRAFL